MLRKTNGLGQGKGDMELVKAELEAARQQLENEGREKGTLNLKCQAYQATVCDQTGEFSLSLERYRADFLLQWR